VHPILTRYSDALGVAYQIRDDLEDLADAEAPDDIAARRPTLPLALAAERAKGPAKDALAEAWHRSAAAPDAAAIRALVGETRADERARQLLEAYKEQAIRALAELQDPSLKGLLRRVVGKIFRLEIKGWCSEFEARNAASGEARAAAAR
jgi:geranylgeranyl pyrophosphate synthase